MKVYSVDLEGENQQAWFFPTQALARVKSKELIQEKAAHVVRMHTLPNHLNAERVCKILHGDTEPWADYKKDIFTYDGRTTRGRRPKSAPVELESSDSEE